MSSQFLCYSFSLCGRERRWLTTKIGLTDSFLLLIRYRVSCFPKARCPNFGAMFFCKRVPCLTSLRCRQFLAVL